MRTENDFNAYLSKELRKHIPDLHFSKLSDKHIAGIPDFMLWSMATSRGLESKMITGFPKTDKGRILTKHPFTQKQLSYMGFMEKTANHAFGLIFCKENNFMYLVRHKDIPESGNWSYGEFKEALEKGIFKVFLKSEIQELLQTMFKNYYQLEGWDE